MKKILSIVLLLSIFISSCKKESNPATDSIPVSISYLKTIQKYLRQHTSDSSYNKLDFDHYRVSKQKDYWFLVVPVKNKPAAMDFSLLKTDSAGNVIDGRNVHMARTKKGSPVRQEKKYRSKFLQWHH